MSYEYLEGAEFEQHHENAFAIISLLIDAGALKNHDGSSLLLPVLNADAMMVKYLINRGASAAASVDGQTLSESAKENENEEVYKILIENGAKPVSEEQSKRLQMMKAARGNNIKKLNIILNAGTSINSKGSNGETALMTALEMPIYDENQLKTVEFLLSKGADPNIGSPNRSMGYQLPLGLVVSWGGYMKDKSDKRRLVVLKVMKTLIDKGAKISGKNDKADTALHIAARADFLDAAKLLIKEGAKVMPKNDAGKTPLDLAESKEMIQLLKKGGARE
jgi:ankyrin repeat protein